MEQMENIYVTKHRQIIEAITTANELPRSKLQGIKGLL